MAALQQNYFNPFQLYWFIFPVIITYRLFAWCKSRANGGCNRIGPTIPSACWVTIPAKLPTRLDFHLIHFKQQHQIKATWHRPPIQKNFKKREIQYRKSSIQEARKKERIHVSILAILVGSINEMIQKNGQKTLGELRPPSMPSPLR